MANNKLELLWDSPGISTAKINPQERKSLKSKKKERKKERKRERRKERKKKHFTLIAFSFPLAHSHQQPLMGNIIK